MRWVIPLSIALCASAAGAVIQARTMVRSLQDAVASASGPRRMGHEALPENDALPAPEGTRGEAADRAPSAQALSEGLDEALGAVRAASSRHRRNSAEQHPSARALSSDLRGQGGAMTDDEARLGSQIQELAQKMAPVLTNEALDYAADKPPVAAEVERDLLDTWKEQKQILAGQRDTIDSVLQAAQ